MPDLGRTNVSAAAYAFGIKHAPADTDTTLQSLTGDRGAELFEPFWPMSRCVYQLETK